MTDRLIEVAQHANMYAAAAAARQLFELRVLGWRGLEEADEVRQLHERCPGLKPAATLVSAYKNNYEPVHQVFLDASVEDRRRLRAYFAGRLTLEEISCALSGAGAGSCDKRAAFMQIWDDSGNWIK